MPTITGTLVLLMSLVCIIRADNVNVAEQWSHTCLQYVVVLHVLLVECDELTKVQ